MSEGVAFWEPLWARAETPWDLGRAPRVLLRLLASLPRDRRRVVVPGAGGGHDAIAWAAAGHDVVALDLAPTAIAVLEARARSERPRGPLEARLCDVLAPPAELDASFDTAWEQTCFCAIPPDRRDDYARALHRLLVPGGLLHGLFWHHGRPGGPPFDVSLEDVRSAFSDGFAMQDVCAVYDSPPRRSGELLITLRRLHG